MDGRHGIKKADVDFFRQLKEAFDKLDKPNDKGSAAKGISSSSASSKGVKAKRSWKLQVVLTKCDLVERKVSLLILPGRFFICMYVYICVYLCMFFTEYL